MDTFVYKDHKKLRCGYTTGTCAAIAAQGAVRFLLTGSWKETEEIMTPKGILVAVSLEEKSSGDGWAECAVRKDAGDDYDVTNGILVYARAEFVKDKNFYQKVQMSHLESSESGAAGEKENPSLRLEDGSQQEKEKPDQQNAESSETLIEIDGGIGIGRVTKPGLDQPVGAAAINSVPRKMIRDAVYALLEEAGEFEEIVRKFGTKRVLYGCDFPYGSQKAAIARIKDSSFSDSEKEDMLWRNAAKILKAVGKLPENIEL